MEIIMEIIFEVYLELMMLIVPEKAASKKYRIFTAVIAIAVLIGIVALFLWGVALIVDENSLIGIIPIAFAVLLSIAQITVGIILHIKKGK